MEEETNVDIEQPFDPDRVSNTSLLSLIFKKVGLPEYEVKRQKVQNTLLPDYSQR
jgi:hypothetical protein